MELYKAIVLGAVQGVTEILPVSSDGHLAVLLQLFRHQSGGELVLTAVLHLGTGLALVIFFLPRIGSIVKDLFSRDGYLVSDSRLLVAKVVLAAIPVSLAGLTLGEYIERFDASMPLVAACLAGNGVFLIVSKLARDRNRRVGWLTAVVIGLSQVFALLPGVSRSGTTIVTALLLGVSGVEAFEFSFLLAIPVTLGAGIFALFKGSTRLPGVVMIFLGVACAFIFGLGGLFLLRRLVKAGRLFWFGIYCLFLAAVLVLR